MFHPQQQELGQNFVGNVKETKTSLIRRNIIACIFGGPFQIIACKQSYSIFSATNETGADNLKILTAHGKIQGDTKKKRSSPKIEKFYLN